MATLLCLPYAGAGASVFVGWARSAPAGLRVLPVQLPGREERFVEPPHTDVTAAVAELGPWAEDALPEGEDVALFGHSLGAVLAFELALRLEAGGRHRVARLVVSGSPGPWGGRDERAAELDDEGFLRRVQEFAGYEHPALSHPEMRELLLPTLRADVTMHEAYRAREGVLLAAPITCLRGTRDELVTAAEADQWSGATTGSFARHELNGGHMYLVDAADAVLQHIATDLGLVRAS